MNPSVTNIQETGSVLRFTLSGVNVSLANAVRRIILSEIPTVVFKTETYQDNQCSITDNTSRLHNEIMKQRLSCIPVYMKLDELDVLPNKYILEVDENNDSDTIMYVTTEHFKIKNKTTGNYLTKEETKKIFPPNKKTNYYIDFGRLRPKVSDNIPGERLKLTAEFSIHTARDESSFNVVSKCAYGNTPDISKIKEQWDTEEGKLKSQDTPSSDIAFQKRNFYILDAQRQYVPDSFDFVIQTIGMYENNDILKMANKILVGKFDTLINEIDSDIVEILTSETTMDHCYDIILNNEDYTVGKVLEYILYEKHYQGDKSLSFCGFKKFHPHDVTSTVRIAFNTPSDKTVVKQRLRSVCVDAQDIFKKIGGMF
jgi:DNA-directed RNA polymerase alpha subunit/DNA-directed RNA polymerase subunit L